MKNKLKPLSINFRNFSLAATAMALLFAASGTASAQCTSCVNAVDLPTGNVTFSTAALNQNNTSDPASGGNGNFTVTLSGVAPGTSLDNTSYAAWCSAWWSSSLETNGGSGARV